MIDVSREAPQGGAKRSSIPYIMPRGRSQTLTLAVLLLLLLPPCQLVLYTTSARGWSEWDNSTHLSQPPFLFFFVISAGRSFFRITAPHCRPGSCWWPATALICFYARPAPVKAAALELRFHIQPRPAERETAREQECSCRSFSPLCATKTTCQGETGARRKY